MQDTMMIAAKQQNAEWTGAKSAKFTTGKQHIAPPQPANGPHPLFNMGGRKHYEAQRCEEWKFKPHRQTIEYKNNEDENPKGMRRIVADYVIVKPKIERLQLQHGVTPDDLKDFVGPRSFLTKYKGVKQKQLDAKLEQERALDRQKRTFTQAGISVVTREGEKTLTVQNAQMLKSAMNAEKMMGERNMSNDDQRADVAAMGYNEGSEPARALMDEDFGHEAAENQLAAISTAHYQERADLEVEALNDWEREHLGGGQDSDSDQ